MANLNLNFNALTKLKDWWEVVKSNFTAVNNQLESHVSGSADKHAAGDITFSSTRPTITADDVKEAIEEVDQRIDGIVNNPDPNKDLELVDFRTSSTYGVFSTAKARGDNTDERLEEIALDIKDFGAVGNANYFNSADNNWYEDELFTILATDDTLAFFAAYSYTTNKMRVINIPAGNYLIDPSDRSKTTLLSNTRLVFFNGAKLVAKESNNYTSAMLEIVGVENIELINPTIEGDKYYNSDTREGAGHGLDCRGVKNLKIINANISKCFTDGIYANGIENFYGYDINCDDNRRQGLSIISAKDFLIDFGTFSNTGGTPPSMGIDIEPNNADENLENIVLRNIKTFNNETTGIGINYNQLNDPSKIINVIIENWTDEESSSAFTCTNYNGIVSEQSSIKLVNPKAVNNKAAGIQVLGHRAYNSAKISIIDPVVYNPNTLGGTNQRQQDVAISVHSETSGYPVGLVQGNVEIINPTISMESPRTILRGIFVGYGQPCEKVSVIDPLKIDIGDEPTVSANNNRIKVAFTSTTTNSYFSDKFKATKLTSASTLVRNFSGGVIEEIILTANATVLLNEFEAWRFLNELIVVHQPYANPLTINLPATYTFYLEDGTVKTTSIASSNSDGIIKFEKITDGKFRIIPIVGTWA